MTDLNKDQAKIVSSIPLMESTTLNTPTDRMRGDPVNTNTDTIMATSSIDPSMFADPEEISSTTAEAGTDVESLRDSLDNISNVSVAGSVASFDTSLSSFKDNNDLESNRREGDVESNLVMDNSLEISIMDEDAIDLSEMDTEENMDSFTDMEENLDPVVESGNMDPEIEMEDEVSIPPAPALSPEEIEQAKKCQMCKTADWKYTCPRCLTHTCSLACVQQHKSEADCSGIRDKTAYVPMRQYNESNMMSGRLPFFLL